LSARLRRFTADKVGVTSVDTGPFLGLFDPKDDHLSRRRKTLGGIRASLSNTIPVLTEAFHILGP
jgi:hypothetical protein